MEGVSSPPPRTDMFVQKFVFVHIVNVDRRIDFRSTLTLTNEVMRAGRDGTTKSTRPLHLISAGMIAGDEPLGAVGHQKRTE